MICLCVGYMDVLCTNGWTDWDAVWEADDSCGSKKTCITWGLGSLTRRGNFEGCPAYWKALGVNVAVYAAKGIIQSSVMHAVKEIIQSSITAWQCDCCSRLQCSRMADVTRHCLQ